MTNNSSYPAKALKNLAWAVINQATKDYEMALTADQKKLQPMAISVDDCYRFLTGKTRIAKFWFSIAEIHHVRLSQPDLERLIMEQYYTDIWISNERRHKTRSRRNVRKN